jgi:hypothetical protein
MTKGTEVEAVSDAPSAIEEYVFGSLDVFGSGPVVKAG